jgi:hypothetical protein
MTDQPMREMTPDEIAQRDALVIERLAVLLTSSAYARMNYTTALYVAKWMFEEAKRCGWFLYV